MKCSVRSPVAGRSRFLPLLFFTSPVGTEPSSLTHDGSSLPAPSLQKPACILSALLIHHCHCFYPPRKAADRPTDRARPLIFLSTLPLTSSSSRGGAEAVAANVTATAPPRTGGGLLPPHVTAKETPLRNISSSTPFSLPRRGVCENSLKMCEDFTVSPFLQGFVFFMR